MNVLRSLGNEYERLFAHSGWVFWTGTGFVFLLLAYQINRYAGIYATLRSGAPLSDALLDAIPRVDTEMLHLVGALVLTVAVLAVLFALPRYFPLALNGLALLVVLRSLFVNMTRLGIYPDAEPLFGSPITFGGDLFFSGHVAIPFFLALVFWRHLLVRLFFLGCSFVLGTGALVGHYHYSIDVFAAPFIAFGVYHFSLWFFESAARVASEEAHV